MSESSSTNKIMAGILDEVIRGLKDVAASIDGLPVEVRTFTANDNRLTLKRELDALAEVVGLGVEFATTFREIEWPKLSDADLTAILSRMKLYEADISGATRYLQSIFGQAGREGSVESISTAVMAARSRRDNFRDILRELLDTFIEASQSGVAVSDDARRFIESWRERFHAKSILADARSVHDEVVELRDATKRATGEVGDDSLGLHFRQYADREALLANCFRGAAIVTLLAISGIGYFAVSDVIKAGQSVGAVLARLSFVLPLALLVAYCGREAGKHRNAAKWAREFQVQLLTFDAFTAPLTEEQRQSLRLEFGKRIFADNSASPVPDQIGAGPGVVGELASLLGSVSDLIKSDPQQSKKE